jgi:hypothetical protein
MRLEVLISYVVQFVSTLLVGPVLIYLLPFENIYSEGVNQFLVMVMNKIMPEINSGNNWIMFSVIVAACIRLSQHPPIFELDFISSLLWFQWLMGLARTVTPFFFIKRLDERHAKSAIWSAYLTVLVLIVTIILTAQAGYPAGAAQSEALVAISHFCAFEKDLPVPLYADTTAEKKPELPIWQQLL